MSSNQDSNGVPNWILFLFGGAILGGVMYTIYMQGFLRQDNSVRLRDSQGVAFVVPTTFASAPARNAAAIANGEAPYKQSCAACHGGNREGLVGPALNDAEWLHYNNENDMARMISRGIGAGQLKYKGGAGGPMPARGAPQLNDIQIWETVYYLSANNPSLVKDASP